MRKHLSRPTLPSIPSHQGRGYKKYLPSLPSPLAGEGGGEGYFRVDDKEIIPQK